VARYLVGFGAEPIAEFVEVERGKRSRTLAEWVRKATLVIAKLDRLARDAHLQGLQRSGITATDVKGRVYAAVARLWLSVTSDDPGTTQRATGLPVVGSRCQANETRG
jgi:hypothetical protein